MARRRRRADAGQAAIVRALRLDGYSIEVLSDVGRGVPDLLVGYRDASGRRGCVLLEVKSPTLPLNPEQIKWHAQFQGDVETVTSLAHARRVLRIRVGRP